MLRKLILIATSLLLLSQSSCTTTKVIHETADPTHATTRRTTAAPTTTVATTTTAAQVQDTQDNYEVDYIANRNTKKFHRPGCPSVKEMNEENKISFHGSREDLIDEGYVPCKRCKP